MILKANLELKMCYNVIGYSLIFCGSLLLGASLYSFRKELYPNRAVPFCILRKELV